jgi:hypothetical protein
VKTISSRKSAGRMPTLCPHRERCDRFPERPQLQKFLRHIAGSCSVGKCDEQTILAIEFHRQYSYRFDHGDDSIGS